MNPVNWIKLPYVAVVLGAIAAGYLLGERREEERFALTQRATAWAMGLVVAFGAALRFYSVDFGLPDAYHPDELQKAHFLAGMIKRQSLDPQFALQPPLLLYLAGAISTILKWLPLEFDNSIVRHLLGGRLVNASCGTISIWLIYCIGSRVSSRSIGLFAAFFLAIVPLHVTNSRYMKEDVLFLTFTLGCLLAVLKSIQEERVGYLYLAGFLAGISFGSKYTGLVTIGIVLASPWLAAERFSFRPDLRRLGHATAAALLMPVGFIFSAPYMLESTKNFETVFGGFRNESHHAMTGHLGYAVDPWSQLWMFHFSNSLIPGVGWVMACGALVGVGIALREWRPRLLFVAFLVALFYFPAEWARSKPPPQPDRYVLACVPFMAILAAVALESFARRFRGVRSVYLAGVTLFMFSPLSRTIELASEIRRDTRRQATKWLYENAPQGTRVLLAGGTVYLPRIPLKLQSKPLRDFVKGEGDPIERMRGSSYRYLITSDFESERFATGTEARDRDTLRERVKSELSLVKVFRPRYGSYGFHNPVVSVYDLKADVGAVRARLAPPN